MTQLLLMLWIVAVLALLMAGTYDVVNIVKSLLWLDRKPTVNLSYGFAVASQGPEIAILLPVLREQRVIVETLRAFARIPDLKQGIRILVITTEKEVADRAVAKRRLPALARDIHTHHIPHSLLIEKYLGVFSQDLLDEIVKDARKLNNEHEILKSLLEAFERYPLTMDLVRREVTSLNACARSPKFTHLHYPLPSGTLNQQLQLGYQYLADRSAEQPSKSKRAYVAIYNADSRPHPATFAAVEQICQQAQAHSGEFPPLLQQSAIFLDNFNHMGSGLRGLFLQAAALLQTRWVFSHEIPRLRRQARAASDYRRAALGPVRRAIGHEFALCVAHGLFLRFDVLAALQLFASDAVSDDFLWSFTFCAEHIPILPLPLLESAESPTTIRSLLIQKRGWFLGYLEYFERRRALLRAGYSRADVDRIALHALLRASKWLLVSPVLLCALGVPVLLHSWVLLLTSLSAYTIYGLLTQFVLLSHMGALLANSGAAGRIRIGVKAWLVVVVSLPAFILESLGPWWSIAQWLQWNVRRSQAYRLKTER